MDLALEKNVPHSAEIFSGDRRIAEGRVVNDGTDGVLFMQWKNHPPLPFDRPLRMRIAGATEVAILKAVAVSPFTYRFACDAIAEPKAADYE